MREWNLTSSDPLSLTLVSDIRFGRTDYVNDHIWELTLGGGVPPALAIQSTFGLRAKAFRIFPRFQLVDTPSTDPATFTNPVIINKVFPNFIELTFSPFSGIDVVAEYWVPDSHCVAGRIQVTNNSVVNQILQMDLVGQLTPNDGQRMASIGMDSTTVLSGNTGGLAPIIFLTGGPTAGAGTYPSLAVAMDLSPNEIRQFVWVQAATPDRESSYSKARETASKNWDAERSRIEMLNAGLVEIYTGNADWDAAFMLAQKSTLGLFVGPTDGLPHPSFVFTREPDQGHSLKGDGSDYNHLWCGQSPLETYYITSTLMASAPDLVEGIFQNYISVQNDDGFIDWKPGLARQRSRLLATPILASIAWRIFEFTEDVSFIQEAFPSLLKFFHAWFKKEQDRDEDGIPEWDHPMQAGSDDHPVYSVWHDWSQAVDITAAESPALCAFLYRECDCLIRMAYLLEIDEVIPDLQASAEKLKKAVDASWHEEQAIYFDWDRDTHLSTQGMWLGGISGPGTIAIDYQFTEPTRLLFHILSSSTTKCRPTIFIHGTGASGNHRVERITDEHFKWQLSRGVVTGQFVYSSVEKIEIQDLEADDVFEIFSVGYDFQEQSLLIPLWAGIPDEERARILVEETITNTDRFWRRYGLQACIHPPDSPEATVCECIHIIWNTLVGEGLLNYGYRQHAAELIKRTMNAIVGSLKRDAAFRRYYHAEEGDGFGESNALTGIAPIGLFLETLGVRLISPTRVWIAGTNPFPWPVTVNYRGLTVLRQKDKTSIIFPDGQTVNIDDPSPQYVSLEAIDA